MGSEMCIRDSLQTTASVSYIAHCENTMKNPIKVAVLNQSNCCILIGPEGDFTTEEIVWAIEKNIHPVDLGDARLRTETAALIALHAALLLNE